MEKYDAKFQLRRNFTGFEDSRFGDPIYENGSYIGNSVHNLWKTIKKMVGIVVDSDHLRRMFGAAANVPLSHSGSVKSYASRER
jgi:hypothetical protein